MKNFNKYLLGNMSDIGIVDKRANIDSIGGRSLVIFNGDGTKMWWIDGSTNGYWRQYDILVPWDLHTLVKVEVYQWNHEIGWGNQVNGDAHSARFSADGTRLIIHDGTRSGNTLFSYTLSEPWEPKSAVLESQTAPTMIDDAVEVGTSGFWMDDSGTKMWVYSWSSRWVGEWSLSTPFDITTATKVIDRDMSLYGGAFKYGTEWMGFDPTGRYLYQFFSSPLDLVSWYECDTPYDMENITHKGAGLRPIFDWMGGWPYGQFVITPNGQDILFVNSNYDSLTRQRMSTPWDINTANPPNKNAMLWNASYPRSMQVSPDGHHLILYSGYWETPIHVTMSKPHNLSTANSYASFTGPRADQYPLDPDTPSGQQWKDWPNMDTLLSPYDLTPRNDGDGQMILSPDGRYMFIHARNTVTSRASILRFELPTPWATEKLPTTAPVYQEYIMQDLTEEQGLPWTYGTNLSYTGTQIFGLRFGNNGSRLFIGAGSNDQYGYQIDLDTPWDLTTANTSTISITYPKLWKVFGGSLVAWNNYGWQFRSDGTEVIFYDQNQNSFVKYEVQIPWDLDSIGVQLQRNSNFPKLSRYNYNAPFTISDDGKHMYWNSFDVPTNTTVIKHAEMENAWDIESFKIDDSDNYYKLVRGHDIGTQILSNLEDGEMTPDGQYYVVMDNNRDVVWQLRMEIPFDCSTINISNSVMTSMSMKSYTPPGGSSIITPDSCCFGDAGRKFYMMDGAGDKIFQWDLKIPYDFHSGNRKYADKVISVSSMESNPDSVSFRPDGKMMYISSSASRYIKSANLTTAWDVTTWDGSSVKQSPQFPSISMRDSITWVDNGRKVLVDYNNDVFMLFDASDAWNVQSINTTTLWPLPNNISGYISTDVWNSETKRMRTTPYGDSLVIQSDYRVPLVNFKRIFGNNYFTPIADANVGNWQDRSGSNTNLYSILTDVSLVNDPLEANTVKSKVISANNASNTDVLRVKIASSVGYRIANTKYNNMLKYRLRCNSLDDTRGNLVVTLLQGNTEIQKWNDTKIYPSRDFMTLEQVISPDKYTMITDGSDLYLEFKVVSSLDEISVSSFADPTDTFYTTILAGPLIPTILDDSTDAFGTHTIAIV